MNDRLALASVTHRLAFACALIGTAGTVLITIAAPHLAETATTSWWFRGPVGSHALATALLYLGIAALVLAWLALGHLLRFGSPLRTGVLLAIGGAWALPLLFAPALFSHDMYSYLAQGTIFRLGRDPYIDPPTVLAHLGQTRVLSAVDPFWRHTTAPYGPAFILLCAAVSAIFTTHLTGAVLVLRLLELVGLGLVAVFLPRLARQCGGNASWALWLVVLSPLALLQLLASGHSDALMLGLMVAGISLALDRHLVVGFTLLALAAMVKVPAGLALLFVLVALVREEQRTSRWRVGATCLGTSLAVVLAVSFGSGLDLRWLSTGLLSTPGKVLLSITPASALAWCVTSVVHGLGAHASARHLSSVFSDIALVGVLVYGIVRLVAVRRRDAIAAVGALLLLTALFGPAAWPWYFAWGLVLVVAGAREPQPLAVLGIVVAAFVVRASGTLALPIEAAPATLACYLGLGGVALWRRTRRTPVVVPA